MTVLYLRIYSLCKVYSQAEKYFVADLQYLVYDACLPLGKKSTWC